LRERKTFKIPVSNDISVSNKKPPNNSDALKKIEKRKRLGEKVKNDNNFQLQNRTSLKIPGTNQTDDNLQNRTSFQLCVKDSNCEEGRYCRNFSCVSGEDGEGCNTDDDCKSKKCKAIVILGKCLYGTVCTSGLVDGESCCKDNDCHAGRCNGFLQCGQRKIGEECKTSKDCNLSKCVDGICGTRQ